VKIKDIMTTNVVTIPSSTSITDAKRIMEAHRFTRLPVVDKGKLLGIVTVKRLEQVSPSMATSLSVWELAYILDKTTVKEIMEKVVLTVSPDMNAEEAIEMAQSHKVGSLLVVENNQIVGIVTTNDFFYKILNPVLGLHSGGTRFEIVGAGNSMSMEKILSIINKTGVKLLNIHMEAPNPDGNRDIYVHVDTPNLQALFNELKAANYTIRER
jgi:acetoin utilization protein AcuB